MEQSMYGQLVLGNKALSSGLDEQLAREITKAGICFILFLLCSMYKLGGYWDIWRDTFQWLSAKAERLASQI